MPSLNSLLDVNHTQTNKVRFDSIEMKSSNNNGKNITIKTPNLTDNFSFTLPPSPGTNGQSLITDGTGILSFSTISGGEGGDITSVIAGDGLTGGAIFGDATLNVVGGTGITVNASDIAIDSTVTTLTGSQTLTNKTLISTILNTNVSGTAIKDEDDMSSDSATHLATQQSIKAYVDSKGVTLGNTHYLSISGQELISEGEISFKHSHIKCGIIGCITFKILM